MFFYDLLNIIFDIWHWMKTISQFKHIIPIWCYYFEFIVFVLLSYIFPPVLNRWGLMSNMLFELLNSNRCCKLRKRCVWFVCFTVFCFPEYSFHAYIYIIIGQSCFLFCVRLKIHCFIIESILCFRFLSPSVCKSKWKYFKIFPDISSLTSSMCTLIINNND